MIGMRYLDSMIVRDRQREFLIRNRKFGREDDLRIALYRLYHVVGRLRVWSWI
jgi:hypothetical protein